MSGCARLGLILLVILTAVVAAPATVIDVRAQSGIANPTDDGVGGSIADAQLFEGDNDGQIVAWERSGFPLRANDTRAATQAPLPGDGSSSGLLQGQELGSGSLSDTSNDGTNSREVVPSFELGSSGEFVQNPAGVFNQADTINLTFDDARADADGTLANQDDVQLVVARIEGSGEGFPNSFSDAVDILSSIDNANENASFRKVVDDETIDSSGTFDQDLNLGPGQYIAYLVVTEDGNNGFEPNSGTGSTASFSDLNQVDGNVAIVGIEPVVVQEGSATVDAPSGEPGDTLDFDVDTTTSFSSGTNVDYAVAVYKQDRFLNSRIDTVIDTSELGPDFDTTQDSEIEHSIEDVIGVADVEDGITINGEDLSDGRLSRSVGLQLVIERFAEDLQSGDGTVPGLDAIDQGGASDSDTEDIKGSVTAIAGASQDETISVETFDNFSTGTYQYIVYAQASDDSTSVSTDVGTVRIFDAQASGSITQPIAPGSSSSTTLSAGGSVSEVSVEATTTRIIRSSVSETSGLPSGKSVNDIESDTGTQIRDITTTVNIDITPSGRSASSTSATIRTTIARNQISGDPSNLRVARLNEATDSFESVSTSVVNRNTNAVTIEFTPSGFSFFTIFEADTRSGGSGGGGSGGGGGVVPVEPVGSDIVEPTLTRDGGTLTAVADAVSSGDIVDIDISQSAGEGVNEISVDRLRIEPQSASDSVRTTVTTSSSPPEGIPDLDRDTDGADPVGYVTADIENLDADETPGTFNFTVSESLLSQPDVEPGDIKIFRFDGGSYAQLDAEYLGGNEFSARTPGFSTFAIGVERSSIVSVSSVSLSQTAVAAGDSVTLTLTAENTGGADGTVTVEVITDGTVVQRPEVTVPAGDTATSTIPLTINALGTYDIVVDGTTAQTLTVESQVTTPESTPTDTPEPGTATPTDTPEPETATPPGTPDDDGGVILPLVIVLIVIIVIAAGVLFARRSG